MLPFQKLLEFERVNSSRIDEARYGDHKIWEAIREQYYINSFQAINGPISTAKRSYSQMFRKMIANLPKLFKRYDYVFFTSDSEKKRLEGSQFDKLISRPCELLKDKSILVVDFQTSFEPTRGFSNVVNGYFFNLLTKLKAKSRKKDKFNKAARDLFDGMEENERIFGYKQYYLHLESGISIFQFFLKLWRPKAVFFGCYSYYPAVFAANSLDIPTIEIQHGIISDRHPAYYSLQSKSGKFRCNFLLSFGESIRTFLSNENIYPRDKIYPIGNYFIEYLNSMPRTGHRDNQKIIVVPTDWSVETDLIDLVTIVAKQAENIKFLISPRAEISSESSTKISGLPVQVSPNNFQELLLQADACLTIDSTCCLEAAALGIPSILYNLDNRAMDFFGKALNDPKAVQYIDNPEQFLDILSNWPFASDDYIEEVGAAHYKSGYDDNFRRFLEDKSLI